MIGKHQKRNFETLGRAFASDNVSLMEVRDKKTGDYVDAICAVQVDLEGNFEFTPFAFMVRDNPYDRFEPPLD